MGLVMQEPTLFNYTIKENILYGNDNAKDSEIREAAQISNAIEFIESSEIFDVIEESSSAFF
jgi:ABC-type multidrug transport system fused ATPase/permease subunit